MSAPDPITLCEARTPQERQQALAIRRQVFIDEQGIPEALEADGLDEVARHVLITCRGHPAATGRLVLTGDGEGVLARIAVLPPFRGRGLGRRVVGHLEALARRAGVRTVTLHPHDYLEAFYASLGYERIPGVEQAGPYRLIKMRKLL